MTAEIVQDADSIIWGKLVINSAINPLTALLRPREVRDAPLRGENERQGQLGRGRVVDAGAVREEDAAFGELRRDVLPDARADRLHEAGVRSDRGQVEWHVEREDDVRAGERRAPGGDAGGEGGGEVGEKREP